MAFVFLFFDDTFSNAFVLLLAFQLGHLFLLHAEHVLFDEHVSTDSIIRRAIDRITLLGAY